MNTISRMRITAIIYFLVLFAIDKVQAGASYYDGAYAEIAPHHVLTIDELYSAADSTLEARQRKEVRTQRREAASGFQISDAMKDMAFAACGRMRPAEGTACALALHCTCTARDDCMQGDELLAPAKQKH